MISENVTYLDNFGVEHIKKKLENLLEINILQQMFLEQKHMIQ